jgi:hypothetical protein
MYRLRNIDKAGHGWRVMAESDASFPWCHRDILFSTKPAWMVAIALQLEQFLRALLVGGRLAVGCAVRYSQRLIRTRCRPALSRLLQASLLLSCLFGGSLSANAQSDTEQSTPVPNPLSMPLPDILSEGTLQPKARLWFYDRDENFILVPEESAEDYFSTRSQAAGGGMGFPLATLEEVVVDGEVQGEVAQLKGRFSVVLSQEYATTVNLAFGSVQLIESTFSGEISHNRLQTVRNDPGWRWIVLSKPNVVQNATLRGVSRIEREQDRRSLRISLPSAPCELHLKLPANADDIRVRNEDVLRRKESVTDAVEVDVSCRGGEFIISWRDRAESPQVAAVVATSETRFEVVDPKQPWLAHTQFKIRWHGRDASNQVRIELPAGGQWGLLPSSDPDRYMTTLVDIQQEGANSSESDNGASDTAATPQLLLENFDVSRNETLEFELEWEWIPTVTETESAASEVNLRTPTLYGVDQHSGIINCIVTRAYAVVSREGSGDAQLVYQAPSPDFARQQLQFEFDRQQYDLSIIFRREQSLPTIRPTYLVHVDRHKLTLTMWFDCSFDTNQSQMELGLMLDEWVIQENTARMVNAPNEPFATEGEVLRVMQQVDRNYVIRSAGIPANNFGAARHVDQTWRVVAERAWNPEDHELYFQVPRIIRGRINGNPEIDHGSGALLVTGESNVLLTWQEAAGTGLQPDSFSTEYQRFVPQNGLRKPMVYRFQSSETTPRWAGRAELLAQQLTAEQRAELEVGSSQISLAQSFRLQIANEPLRELRFAVRKDLADHQTPQTLIQGQLVSVRLVETVDESQLDQVWQAAGRLNTPAEVPADSGSTLASLNPKSAWQIYEILGAPEMLGAIDVQILSSIPWKKNVNGRGTNPEAVSSELASPIEEEVTRVEVPLAKLVLPRGAQRVRQSWSLKTASQLEATVVSSSSSEGITAGSKTGELTDDLKKLLLELRPRRMLGAAPVHIDVSWLQTFVNAQKRRERYVARVQANSNELRLKLPKEANIREGLVKVSVDGLEHDYRYDQPSDIVTIQLSGSAETQHVVEVSYFLPDSLSWITPLKVSPPEILGAVQTEQFYWQLLTPAVQHLGWSPRELTAEWTWQWGGLCWKRTSPMSQRQLEELIGALPQEPPPASANSYVMSGRGTDGTAKAWILSRFILWFPVGLVAIAITFVALNFAVVRKPAVVFTLAIGLAALATIWPDLATLAGQTALLSLGLVALVWVLQAAVDSRVRRRSVFSTRPSTYMDRSDYVTVSRGSRSAPNAPAHGSSAGTSGG